MFNKLSVLAIFFAMIVQLNGCMSITKSIAQDELEDGSYLALELNLVSANAKTCSMTLKRASKIVYVFQAETNSTDIQYFPIKPGRYQILSVDCDQYRFHMGNDQIVVREDYVSYLGRWTMKLKRVGRYFTLSRDISFDGYYYYDEEDVPSTDKTLYVRHGYNGRLIKKDDGQDHEGHTGDRVAQF